MKNICYAFFVFLVTSTPFAQSEKLSGKFRIMNMSIYEDGNKTMDIAIEKSGECPYSYSFFETGKMILSAYNDDNCTDEISSEGSYTILNKVLTIQIDGEMESFSIESNSEAYLVLSFTEEESRGFAGLVIVKYEFTFKRV